MFSYLKMLMLIFCFSVSGALSAKDCPPGQSSGDYRRGYDDGYNKGDNDGYKKGYDKGKTGWYDKGKKDGYKKGKNDGYNGGYSKGKKDGYDGGYDDGYNKGSGDKKEYYGYCAFIYKIDGLINTSDLQCQDSSDCDDYEKNTIDLCVISKEPY